MVLVVERRAEIAIRSLSRLEQAQVRRALDEIGAIAPDELCQSSKFQNFRGGSGETFYVYPGAPSLKLILSINDDKYTIEDVIDRDKLSRLPLNLVSNEESQNSLIRCNAM
jgi:hypothetical protein